MLWGASQQRLGRVSHPSTGDQAFAPNRYRAVDLGAELCRGLPRLMPNDALALATAKALWCEGGRSVPQAGRLSRRGQGESVVVRGACPS
jgi:hypothetical protein